MRVDQPYNHLSAQRAVLQKAVGKNFENTLQKSETKGNTVHERLEQALEEKSWLTEQIQNGKGSLGELGKHLDLRV